MGGQASRRLGRPVRVVADVDTRPELLQGTDAASQQDDASMVPPVAANEGQTSARRRGRRGGVQHRAPPPGAPLQILKCLWCPNDAPFTAHNGAGLLSHITRMHGGQNIELAHVQQLRNLNKGTCTECGCLRGRQTRVCPWCCRCTRLRDPAVGDKVLDREFLGSATALSQRPSAAASAQLRADPGLDLGPTGAIGNAGPIAQMTTSIPDLPLEAHEDLLDEAAELGNSHFQQSVNVNGGSTQTAARRIAAPRRTVHFPSNFEELCQSIPRQTAERVPESVVGRFANSWAECLEGMLAGDGTWSRLAKYRCRLLLGSIPFKVDRIDEIKTRLALWESGKMGDLAARVHGQVAQRSEESSRALLTDD
eukprot:9584490-Karenia_brevis.AAC.1